MTRIKGKDIYLKDDDQIYFGDNNEAALWFDNGELQLDSTISGVDPVLPGHLVTKKYVDELTSGDVVSNFTDLLDTQSSYVDKAGYVVSVNNLENGLEFTTPGLHNIDGGFAFSVYGGVPTMDGGGA